MERLLDRDLRAALGVAKELGDLDTPETFNASVLPLLVGLVPADTLALNVVFPSSRRAQMLAIHPQGADQAFPGPTSLEILGTYALQNPLIRAALPSAHKWSDFLSRAELHRLELYALLYEPTAVEHQMAFTVPSGDPEAVVGFVLNRATRDFSERDRAVLDCVRPFVSQTYRRVSAGPRIRTAGELELTPRQHEILTHLAGGLTDAQLAARLGLAERTVGKHLENIYTRLGVSGRTAAVALALGLR